jgi:hypothetical protein
LEASLTLTVRNSIFEDNDGAGLWLETTSEANSQVGVFGNVMRGNRGDGMVLAEADPTSAYSVSGNTIVRMAVPESES